MDFNLSTTLLQLNPPVLVRTKGGDVDDVDLAALRRAPAGAVVAAAALASQRHASSSGAAAPSSASLPASKLHTAKRTAQNFSRHERAINGASTMPQTLKLVPSSQAGVLQPIGKTKRKPSEDDSKSAMGSHLAAAAAISMTHHRSTADLRHSSASSPPSLSAGSLPQCMTDLNNQPHLAAIATATAPCTTDEQGVSLNIPYLMRHVNDMGALLDTLFPLRVHPASEHAYRSPSCQTSFLTGHHSANDDGTAEELHQQHQREQLIAVQTVSAAPASRDDVMALHATLQARLNARRARPTGLCPIRRTLYQDLFSELVRQIAVEEPVRGLLLARVREEAEHSLLVHASLLREGEQFVARKLLQDTQSSATLKERITALSKEKVALEVRQHELLEECKDVEQGFEEERQIRHKRQQDELNFLRRTNQQLSLRLKMETERESGHGEVDGGGDNVGAAATTSL